MGQQVPASQPAPLQKNPHYVPPGAAGNPLNGNPDEVDEDFDYGGDASLSVELGGMDPTLFDVLPLARATLSPAISPTMEPSTQQRRQVHDATATAYSNGIAATELQQLARVNVLYLHILEFPARIQPSASISVGSPPPSSICVAPSPPVGPTTLPPTIIHILSNHCPLQRTHPVVARDGPTRSVARRWSSAGTRWFKVTSAAPTTTFTHAGCGHDHRLPACQPASPPARPVQDALMMRRARHLLATVPQ
eukprot:COSAG01_NODE_1300_length_10830_cov_25.036716_12_plen_250_part_00